MKKSKGIRQTKTLLFESEAYYSRDDLLRLLSASAQNRKGVEAKAYMEIAGLLDSTFLNSRTVEVMEWIRDKDNER